MTITDHTSLLNYLATTFNLQSYLEIGVRKPELNFDKIKCLHKSGVDPDITPECILNPITDNFYFLARTTSDQYFTNAFTCLTCDYRNSYDLIFIDGLHHADQVKRDFENSLKCLTDNGFIVIHDTLPTHEKYTHVPRDSKTWYGDVYKFVCSLINYSGINFCTLDIDCGCTIVWKDSFFIHEEDYVCAPPITNWQEFLEHKDFLQIHSVEQFLLSCKFGLREHDVNKMLQNYHI